MVRGRVGVQVRVRVGVRAVGVRVGVRRGVKERVEAHLFVEFDDLGGEWLGQLLEDIGRLLARGEAGGGFDQGLRLG